VAVAVALALVVLQTAMVVMELHRRLVALQQLTQGAVVVEEIQAMAQVALEAAVPVVMVAERL
jgi:hypothetical protein